MLLSTTKPQFDIHGYGLGIAIFGASIGGLMAFAGVVTLFKKNWGLVVQLPLILYAFITYYIFLANYA